MLHAGAAAPQSTWEPVAPAGLPAAHIPEGGGLLSMLLSGHTEQRIPAVCTHACLASRYPSRSQVCTMRPNVSAAEIPEGGVSAHAA